MTTKADLRAISHLLGDALSQFARLFQNEVDLAKAELGEKVQQIGAAVGLIAAGAVLVIPAIVMALFALSAALIAGGWSQPVSYLISAIAAAVPASGRPCGFHGARPVPCPRCGATAPRYRAACR